MTSSQGQQLRQGTVGDAVIGSNGRAKIVPRRSVVFGKFDGIETDPSHGSGIPVVDGMAARVG